VEDMQQEMEVYQPVVELVVDRKPNEVLQEAHLAAAALKDVISKKKKPVMFNGEQYLEFEDWQTIAKFYGIGVMVEKSDYIDLGGTKGFEARATAVHLATGKTVSSADSMCLDDERNWKGKPLFMLKSMAQTRACAKALRNVLAWVVVLAGYKPTPSEEMDGVFPEKLKPAELEPSAWDKFREVRLELGVSEADAKTFLGDRIPKGKSMTSCSPLQIATWIEELKRKFAKVVEAT
jgi:hypothetical protein